MKKSKGATAKVNRWAQKGDGRQTQVIDRKTLEAKRLMTHAIERILISVGEYTLQIKNAERGETACKRCCFAMMGKSTRHCPSIIYGGKSFHLCTCFGDGHKEYFIETNAINKQLFQRRRGR